MSDKDRFEEIKVKNFYYLLAYAFNDEKIYFNDDEKFGAEQMKNIYDLFSIVLYIRLKELLQKGIYCEYVGFNKELPYIKGRVDILNTVRSNSLKLRNKVICNFDDYSENNIINQIIKRTIYQLLNCNIMNINRIKLTKLYYVYENVTLINDPNDILWDNIRFNKLNNKYTVIIKICKYILNDLIMNKNDNKEKFTKIDDGQEYHKLFEKFIRNYLNIYFKKYREKPIDLNIKIDTIKWDIDDNPQNINEKYIPSMHTDVTISRKNKVKIIDAKFYANILSNKGINGVDSYGININNWYQIFSYIMNKRWKIEKKYEQPEVSGMILYISTGDEFKNFRINSYIHGMKMEVKVIDFTQEFGDPEKNPKDATIAGQMKKIAEQIYNDLK